MSRGAAKRAGRGNLSRSGKRAADRIEKRTRGKLDADRVADRLWIGGKVDLRKWIPYTVVLCAEKIQPRAVHAGNGVIRCPMPDAALSPVQKRRAVATMVRVHQVSQQRSTLVTCYSGLNRSALIVAGVLMLRGLGADEAIATVRAHRSQLALGNSHFLRLLRNMDSSGTAASLRQGGVFHLWHNEEAPTCGNH